VRRLAKSGLGADPNGHRAEFLRLVDAAERLDSKKAVGKPERGEEP
jgi:hypothetical protein